MAALTRRCTFAEEALSGLADATFFRSRQRVDMKDGIGSSRKPFRPTVESKNFLLDAGSDQEVVEFRTSLRAMVDYGEANSVPVIFQDRVERL